ncbi:MAG: hypothetical protein L0Y72_22505 [Gemmataceae bacterium]|nr:hypothetical protein [Gemmataceae bacterium]
MKNACPGQAAFSKCCPLVAGLAALTLTMLPLTSRAGKPADKRPEYMIGYTVHRTDLPGYFPNRVTSQAFVVKGDGSGTTELAPELVTKPHQSTQLGGWSPDGRQAILYQTWRHVSWRCTCVDRASVAISALLQKSLTSAKSRRRIPRRS